MPKKLMLDIFRGHHEKMMSEVTTTDTQRAPELAPPPEGEALAQQQAPDQGAGNVA